MWSILPRHDACWLCKLDHEISFDPMVRFRNQKHCCNLQNQKIIFMICNEWINACNAKAKWCMWCKNKMTHVMQEWLFFFGYMNGHSSHLPWLNHECKIECLQWLSIFCFCSLLFLLFILTWFLLSLACLLS